MWRKISLYGFPLAMALVAACGGSENNSSGDGGGGGGGGGSSISTDGGGGSGDGGGATCGFRTCSASEVCCFGAAGQTCMAAGSCTTGSLTCTAKSMCASGQSCCFTYVGDSGTDFTATCQASCDSTSYELCGSSADCSNGGMCFPGPYARYCAAPFDGGGFVFPDGGFFFPRRDAGMEADGSDGATTNPSGDDGSAPTSDGASE